MSGITTDSTLITIDTQLVTTDGGVIGGAISGTTTLALSVLQDLFHYWSDDLSSSPSGDLQQVSGTVRGQQRVLRRLLCNPATDDAPGDYIFHPEYGGGLPRLVGQPIDIAKTTAVIRTQLALEAAVAPSPQPSIAITQSRSDYTAFTVSISYQDAVTAKPVVLTFTVSA